MLITINTEVLNENKITPTHYVMLYYLHHKLDCKLSNQTRNDLFKLGFIDEIGNITYKGRSLFNQPDTIKESTKSELEDLLNKMLVYFPKGIKNQSGKPVRTSINAELIQKIKKFKKEYKHTDEIILKATQRYSEERKKDGYSYMRQFKYFIHKQGEGSDLADYCEIIINGQETTLNGGRNTKTL